MMKIVSNQTEEQIKAAQAVADFEYELCEMTANLLRVIRGAGRPYNVAHQIKKCAEAIEAHKLAIGLSISGEAVKNALQTSDEVDWRRFSSEEYLRHHAEQTMVRGALQMTASKLISQRTQEAAGKSEFYVGLREMERLNEERRRQNRAARVAALPKAKKKAPAKQAKRKAAPPESAPAVPSPQIPNGGKKQTNHKAALAAYKAARGIE